MLTKKVKFIMIATFTFSLFLGSTNMVLAACDFQGPNWLTMIGIPDGLIIPCACIDDKPDPAVKPDGTTECKAPTGVECTPCGLSEALQTLVNFSNVILAFTGSGALLMFTLGGLMFIISAGSQEKVQQGKKIMEAAVIGIVIILGSWLIVNTLINALTSGKIGGSATIFGGKSPYQEVQVEVK